MKLSLLVLLLACVVIGLAQYQPPAVVVGIGNITGIVKATSGIPTSSVAADIIALFKGSCSVVPCALGSDGNLLDVSVIQTLPVVVSALGPCNSAVEGTRKAVTDSNAVSLTAGIGAAVAGGGSTHVPVYCDGANWRID